MSEQRIKVMHLIWSMKDGGAQQVVINYLRDFKDDPDIDLCVCVYTEATKSKYDKEIAEKDYPVTYLNNPKSRIKIPVIRYPFNRMVARREWYKAIIDFKPDIVHVHISELLSVVLKPIVEANVPVRFDTLHSHPLRYKGKNLKKIREAFNKYGFIPLCVTEEQGEVAKEHYGFSSYELVRNGIDTRTLESQKIDKKEARTLLRVPENAFVVLGVGRLSSIKNFPLLIRTFSQVCKRNDKAILLMAGDGEELESLKRLTEELKLKDRVYFLGNRTDMNVIYSSADVIAMTSISEAAPLTLIEAQVMGVRCVVSSGVPAENFITPSARKMRDNASDEEWAEAILDNNYQNDKYGDIDDYDVHHISRNLKDIYLKYWNEYKK